MNIEWAFNAAPSPVVSISRHVDGFGHGLQQYTCSSAARLSGTTLTDGRFTPRQAAHYELANMEWWNILNGRPQLTPSASPDDDRGLGVGVQLARTLG